MNVNFLSYSRVVAHGDCFGLERKNVNFHRKRFEGKFFVEQRKVARSLETVFLELRLASCYLKALLRQL